MDDEPAFGNRLFKPLKKDSVLRESSGFIPFFPDEDWKIGHDEYAFKVRVDKRTPNSTILKMRLDDAIRTHTEVQGPPSPQTRRKIKIQVEEELLQETQPKPTIIECVIQGSTLFVGTNSRPQVSEVLSLLQSIGVECEYQTPWMDEEDQPFSEYVDLKHAGQSILGCQFLRKLMNDPEVMVEPEKGSVKLITQTGAKVSLSAGVLHELDTYLETECELLAAKILINDLVIMFNAFNYQFSGVKFDLPRAEHWTEHLGNRLDRIKSIWDLLDQKYQTSMG